MRPAFPARHSSLATRHPGGNAMGTLMPSVARPAASHWKRAGIHIHPDVHRELKAEAAIRGITLRELHHQILVGGLRRRGRLQHFTGGERPA